LSNRKEQDASESTDAATNDGIVQSFQRVAVPAQDDVLIFRGVNDIIWTSHDGVPISRSYHTIILINEVKAQFTGLAGEKKKKNTRKKKKTRQKVCTDPTKTPWALPTAFMLFEFPPIAEQSPPQCILLS
jgi:hypothetical protein